MRQKRGARLSGMAMGMPYLRSPSRTSVLSLYCTRKRQVMRTVATTRLCAAVLIAGIVVRCVNSRWKSNNAIIFRILIYSKYWPDLTQFGKNFSKVNEANFQSIVVVKYLRENYRDEFVMRDEFCIEGRNEYNYEREEEEGKILKKWENDRGIENPLRSRSVSRYCTIAPRTAARKSTSPHSVSMAVQRARAISCLRWTTAEAEEARTMKPHTTVPVSNSVLRKPYIDIQTTEKYPLNIPST